MARTKTTERKLTTLQKETEERLRARDFHYFPLDCDYDTIHDCSRGYCDEWACRCGEIVDCKIRPVTALELADAMLQPVSRYRRVSKNDDGLIFKDYKVSPQIFRYGIERIWSHYLKRSDLESRFYINIAPGYYGEEIQHITLTDDTIINALVDIVVLGTTQLVQYLLELEYGYLLDSLKDCEFVAEDVNLDAIKVPNDHYVKKLDRELVESYKSYKLFVGIVDEKYNLLDGYHRTLAAKANNEKTVEIIRAIKEA